MNDNTQSQPHHPALLTGLRILFYATLAIYIGAWAWIMIFEFPVVMSQGLGGYITEECDASQDCVRYVEHVLPRSPAAQAGLEAGDQILSYNGLPEAIDDVNDPALATGMPIELEVRKESGAVETLDYVGEPGWYRRQQTSLYVVFGVEPQGMAILDIILQIITVLPVWGFAVILVQRRPRDLVVLLLGIALLMLGFDLAGFAVWNTNGVLSVFLTYPQGLGSFALILFIFLFPDGRWAPPHSWIAAVGTVVSIGVIIVIKPAGLISGILRWAIVVPPIYLIMRYRSYTTPSQRQQIKWVVYAFVLLVVGVLSTNLIINALDDTTILYYQVAFGNRIFAITV